MAQRKTLTLSIAPQQDAFVRDHMASGRYASASEVVRAGLRSLRQDEDRERRRRSSAPTRPTAPLDERT